MTTTRKIWSVDLRVWATAYVVADTLEDAEAMFRREFLGGKIEVLNASPDCDPPIYGGDFNSEDMPAYSLSPAMTIDPDQPDGWDADIALAFEVEAPPHG